MKGRQSSLHSNAFQRLRLPPELVTFPRARRLRAACFACFDRAALEAAERGSRFNASRRARERLAEVFAGLPLWPFSRSRSARFRVASETRPLFGGGRSTPARRAFDRPIAMACFADRAPCFPCRMCSISSRTNSPACVVGAFPSALSLFARSMVFFSGIRSSSPWRDSRPTQLRLHECFPTQSAIPTGSSLRPYSAVISRNYSIAARIDLVQGPSCTVCDASPRST